MLGPPATCIRCSNETLRRGAQKKTRMFQQAFGVDWRIVPKAGPAMLAGPLALERACDAGATWQENWFMDWTRVR